MDVKFTINKCKTKKGYSVKWNKKINLAKIGKDYEIEMDTPILLVIRTEVGRVLVHEYGELIFRECEDVDKIKETAKIIYSKGAI